MMSLWCATIFLNRGHGSILLTTRLMPLVRWQPPSKWTRWACSKAHSFYFVEPNALSTLPMKRSIRQEILSWRSIIFRWPLIRQEPISKKHECSFADYLDLYQNHHKVLLARRGSRRSTIPTRSRPPGRSRFRRSSRRVLRQPNSCNSVPFWHQIASPRNCIRDGAAYWPASAPTSGF